MQKFEQVIFPKPESVGARDWGEEILIALIPGILTLKKLIIRAGNKGGLQYHRKKNECGILLAGKLLVRHQNTDGHLVETVLTEGEAFHFPPNSIHQEEAITDCVIIEASSPHFNDRVRVEQLFGMISDFGMETTTLDEIEEK